MRDLNLWSRIDDTLMGILNEIRKEKP
jgi:hypothetical protein